MLTALLLNEDRQILTYMHVCLCHQNNCILAKLQCSAVTGKVTMDASLRQCHLQAECLVA